MEDGAIGGPCGGNLDNAGTWCLAASSSGVLTIEARAPLPFCGVVTVPRGAGLGVASGW